MSNCGKCGGSTGCTCAFGSNPTATVTGNGRTYAAINYHPNNVPSPRPYGQIKRLNSDQVIPISSVTPVVFDTFFSVFEGSHGGSMVNLTTYPSRLTCPVGGNGYYLAAGFVRTSGDNNDILSLRKNGVTNLETQIGTSPGERCVTSLIDMVAGDYLELVINTASTGGVTVIRVDSSYINSDCHPHFWAQWVRPT